MLKASVQRQALLIQRGLESLRRSLLVYRTLFHIHFVNDGASKIRFESPCVASTTDHAR